MQFDEVIQRLALEAGLPSPQAYTHDDWALAVNGVEVTFHRGSTPERFYLRACVGQLQSDQTDRMESLLSANQSIALVCGNGLGMDDENRIFLGQNFACEALDFPDFFRSFSYFADAAQAWQDALAGADVAREAPASTFPAGVFHGT